MDPYAVLGLPATASLDEVEAAYRRQVRAWHPDLHQHEGPAAVREAEAHTRSLNDALARIRAAGGSDPGPSRWPPPSPPPTPAASVSCPFCGIAFSNLPHYEHHLTTEHGVRSSPGDRLLVAQQRVADALQHLRYVPAWLLAVCLVASLFSGLPGLMLGLGALLVLVLAVQSTRRGRTRRRPRPSRY